MADLHAKKKASIKIARKLREGKLGINKKTATRSEESANKLLRKMDLPKPKPQYDGFTIGQDGTIIRHVAGKGRGGR
jgi:hypothetical protein